MADRRIRALALVTLPSLGASNRLRIEQYAPLLRDQGIDLDVSAFFDESAYRVLYRSGGTPAKAWGVARGLMRRVRDAGRLGSYDVVIVHRESAPLGPPLLERLLASRGIPYVFDFDDAIFLSPVHPANRRWAWLRHPTRVPYAVAGAAAVIAGNAYLAAWARRWNQNVTVIATPVDARRYRPRPYPAIARGPLVIGWVGSSTTAPYLTLLDEPLDAIARTRDVLVKVVGGRYEHPRARVECIPWSIEREASELQTFDVGVLPEPDDEWTRGKGAFKALLYMASAVPVVASRIGVNPEVIADGESGLCVEGDLEWSKALRLLLEDQGLRERMGRAGRARMERQWSLQIQAPRFASVLRDAAEGG